MKKKITSVKHKFRRDSSQAMVRVRRQFTRWQSTFRGSHIMAISGRCLIGIPNLPAPFVFLLQTRRPYLMPPSTFLLLAFLFSVLGFLTSFSSSHSSLTTVSSPSLYSSFYPLPIPYSLLVVFLSYCRLFIPIRLLAFVFLVPPPPLLHHHHRQHCALRLLLIVSILSLYSFLLSISSLQVFHHHYRP